MNKWTVQFNDYLKFEGVRDGIKQVKAEMKQRDKEEVSKIGVIVEDVFGRILSDMPGFTVSKTTPQMDIGFGADYLVSYKEEDKNYSFYVDITTKAKPISYLDNKGNETEDFREAFCYRTEYFNVYFGLKERHVNRFFYEKPVVVMYIKNFVPCTGTALHHINNMGHILMSLNALLVRKDYGARASTRVRPNIRRFYLEYKAHLEAGQ